MVTVTITTIVVPCNFDCDSACLGPLFNVFDIGFVAVHPLDCCYHEVSLLHHLTNCSFTLLFQSHYFVQIFVYLDRQSLESLPLELHYQLFDPLPCLNLGQILAYPLNLPFDSRRARDYQPTFSSPALHRWTALCCSPRPFVFWHCWRHCRSWRIYAILWYFKPYDLYIALRRPRSCLYLRNNPTWWFFWLHWIIAIWNIKTHPIALAPVETFLEAWTVSPLRSYFSLCRLLW